MIKKTVFHFFYGIKKNDDFVKLEVSIENSRSDFVINVLRTKQYIHRIRSIDIISLREIPAIACRVCISIEPFVHP